MDPMKVPLEDLIEKRYEPPKWAVIRELRAGVGFSQRGTDRAIDVAAFGCWPSSGLHRIAYEVKRSRHDFMREIDNPLKREWVEKNFHQTYFVTSSGVCKPEEVPESWGLYVATKNGDKLRRVKVAKHRDAPELPELLALSAIRALSMENLRLKRNHYYFEGMWIQQHQLDEMIAAGIEEELVPTQLSMQHQLETATAEAEEYRKKRVELQRPLVRLAKEVGDHMRFSSYRYDQTRKIPVTVEEVEKWISRVRSQAIKPLLLQLRSCASSIDQVMALAKQEGFDGA
jgi:hypothetical protein